MIPRYTIARLLLTTVDVAVTTARRRTRPRRAVLIARHPGVASIPQDPWNGDILRILECTSWCAAGGGVGGGGGEERDGQGEVGSRSGTGHSSADVSRGALRCFFAPDLHALTGPACHLGSL